MSSMTPIRIRGKRTATTDEKWHHGKPRKLHPSRTASGRASSVVSSSSEKTSLKQRRRERRDPILLSRLEQLPTEILQTIFEFSCNPDLPLASPRLASQLDSPHLLRELTSRIFHPVHGTSQPFPKIERPSAQRLLNSRFCTWHFFADWLSSEFNEQETLLEAGGHGSEGLKLDPEGRMNCAWYELCYHGGFSGLSPPRKLLHGPFTDDKVRFLKLLSSWADPLDERAPLYRELAKEGLKQAVAEGASDALQCFWDLGLAPDTDLLRLAVIHAGCKKQVVQNLLNRAVVLRHALSDVDFLDPALWSWADSARATGDERGTWLMGLLKHAQH